MLSSVDRWNLDKESPNFWELRDPSVTPTKDGDQGTRKWRIPCWELELEISSWWVFLSHSKAGKLKC